MYSGLGGYVSRKNLGLPLVMWATRADAWLRKVPPPGRRALAIQQGCQGLWPERK